MVLDQSAPGHSLISDRDRRLPTKDLATDMGKWAVWDDGDELFIVESRLDGRVSLHIPSPEPLIVTRALAEQIRMFIGAAVADTCAGQSS